ncbi:MAG: hypothetical protein NTZ83_01260 [Candidatus Pacearchaeota archaeon]|nr:hypothetical protein [Candidatus Pacearchaeota archaeon]
MMLWKIDVGWTLIASLIFLVLSFLIIKFWKSSKKRAYLLIGIISLISIILYILIPSILMKRLVIDFGIISLLLAILIGNGLGVLISKEMLK